ncbi:MAG: isovaleryl-CoA dehydrogenase [Pseudomonadota bacterium]
MSITTHEVFNQSTPFADVNLFTANKPLQDALAQFDPGYDREHLHALGAEAGSASMQEHARLANLHKPVLHTHDRFGRRLDEVEFHPSYHVLLGSALRHGLHGAPWSGQPGAHVERAAAFMLFTELEPSVLCPVSMSYAVTPALRGNPAIARAWMPRIVSTHYDSRFLPFDQKFAVTLGMGMTEKQGGSDVRANTTRAEFDADTPWGRAYRITGHKWFFSAPMCDAFLVLAQAANGLSCFFLPRILPDGQVNALRIQRLKDKLGNQANASSEVEFHGATAWLVGEEGRGVPQILAMGALTRLDCALGTAGLMRHALSIALHHCAERSAFGKPLIEQPLMRNVLADMALESEAATLLALRLAAAIDRTEHGQDPSGFEAVMRRLITPVAKFWICKRGSMLGQEAMECLGGNGYVEEQGEGVMARIYREMPLNSIWEGAGNIMALDLLRALRGTQVMDALMHELQPARGEHPAFDAEVKQLLHTVDGVADEAQARRLVRSLALVLQAAELQRTSPDFVFDAFCASRLAGDRATVFGLLPATTDFDSIVSRAMPH